MPAASYLCSPTSWGVGSSQGVGRGVRVGVGRGVGAGVGRGVGTGVGAGSTVGTGVGTGVGGGSTGLEGRVGVALRICGATVGAGDSATDDEVGTAAAANDDGGDWPSPGVALVTAAGVPNASSSSPAGLTRPPIVNASTDAARTTVPSPAIAIGARQALGARGDAPPLSPATPTAAPPLTGAAAPAGAAAPTALAAMPHPGHTPAARVQHRSHAYTPQDGHFDSPICRRCAAGPIRLPHRSQNGRDGPPVGPVTRGPLSGTAPGPPPPTCPDGPDAGDAFAMDSCVPSNGSPDTMLRALRRGSSSPAGLRHRPPDNPTPITSARVGRNLLTGWIGAA
jgi:hypothetical protein